MLSDRLRSVINRAASYNKQMSGKQTPSRTTSSDQKQRNASPSSNSRPQQNKQRAISQQAQREKYMNPHHSGTKYDSINESFHSSALNMSMAQPSRHANNYSFEATGERSRSSHPKERPQLNSTLNYIDPRVKHHPKNMPAEGRIHNLKQNGNAKRANSTKKY